MTYPTNPQPKRPDRLMTDAEANALAALASQRRKILEIGPWRGGSTLAMAQAAPHALIVSVDPHTQHETANRPDFHSWGPYLEMLRDFDLWNVIPIRAYSADVPKISRTWDFDMVFLDGDHTLWGMRRDLIMLREICKPGTVLACHDFDHPDFPGIRQALEEARCPQDGLVDTLWIGRLH